MRAPGVVVLSGLSALSLFAATRAPGKLPQTEVSSRPQASALPWQRCLGGEDEARVAALERRIVELRTQGMYGEAIPLAEEVVGIRARAQGDDHWQVLDAHRLVATLRLIAAMPAGAQAELAEADRADEEFESLYGQTKYREALGTTQRQLGRRKRWLGDQHTDVAKSLYQMAVALRANGQYPAAGSVLGEALGIQRKLLGDEHPDISATLNELAIVARGQGDFAQAQERMREVLAMDRKLLGDEHRDVATDLNNLGMLLLDTGDYRGAEALLSETLRTRRKLFPDGHKDLATSISNLAGVFEKLGDFTKAESLQREALAMRRRLHGDLHADVATGLNNLGLVLLAQGKYAEAEDLLVRALATRREVLGDEHPDLAKSLHNLGLLRRDTGEYVEAERLFREAQAMTRKLLGDDHPNMVNILGSLGLLLEDQGDYATAEPLLREALVIARRVYGDESAAVATSLSELAGLLQHKGDYVAAEPLYREALEMQRKKLGTGHSLVGATLNNLAGLLEAEGNHEAAETTYKEALEIARRAFGAEHNYVANTLNNLAGVLHGRGDYEGAEPLFREALDMHRRLLGGGHPAVATDLQNLANLLRAKGAAAAAEPLFRDALATLRQILGNEHPSVANCLNNLAYLHDCQGKFAEAEPLYREALAICEKQRTRVVGAERERALFGGSLKLGSISARLARVLLQQGRAEEAFAVVECGRGRAALDLLARAGRDLVAEVRAAGDERVADELSRALRVEGDRGVALTKAESTLVATERREDLSPEDKQRLVTEQLQTMMHARQQLANAQAAVLSSLRTVWPDAQPLGTERIRAALAPGDLLLSFSWSNEGIALFVVPASSAEAVTGFLVAKDPPAVKELTDRAGELARAISGRPTEGTDSAALRALRRELADRLLPTQMRVQLSSAGLLIVLPEGPLTGIPFELLTPTGDGPQGGVERAAEPQVVYAESATIYLNRRAERAKRRGGAKRGEIVPGEIVSAVILGNPDFGRSREQKYPEKGVLIAKAMAGGNAAQAGLRRGDTVLGYDGHDVGTLETLVAKVTEVAQRVEAGERKADRDVPVRFWRDGEVHETTVAPGKLGVELDSRPPREGLELLALRSRGPAEMSAEVSATDQYRLFGKALDPLPGTEQEARAIAALFGAKGGAEPGGDRDVVLLLGADATIGRLETAVRGRRFVHIATHGLMGSHGRPYDASLALTRPDTLTPQDIGFLTLEHLISHWRGKLDGCELVVLSACDTQRGVNAGDSVMALPWGFFYAGAPSVVASLWKVDDTATALLMMRFYENLLGAGHVRTEARGHEGNSGGNTKKPRRPLSKAEALREAKLWLRGLSTDEVISLCQVHGLPRPSELARGEPGALRRAGEHLAHPFEPPYFWSAFVLVGDPD